MTQVRSFTFKGEEIIYSSKKLHSLKGLFYVIKGKKWYNPAMEPVRNQFFEAFDNITHGRGYENCTA